MLRPSRSLTIALLWLAIVLLPVRAWAAAAMPIAMTEGPVVAMQAADAVQHGGAMPCHGESHPDDDAAAAQSCSLCGVCHSAFPALPGMQPSVSALPQARPVSAAAPAVEPAALAGPERPPRPFLA